MTDVLPPSPPTPDTVIPEHRPIDYQPGNLIEESQDALWPPAEAERSFLAALLGRDDTTQVLWRAAVETKHFADPNYGAIFDAMVLLRDRGETIDYLSVAEQLNPAVEPFLWHINDHWANPGFVEHFADQILARFRRSNVRDLGGALVGIADQTPTSALDSTVEYAVEQALSGPGVRDVQMADLAGVAYDDSEDEQFLPTPWETLDRAIVGFLPGALYTLSGDTGSGKSAIALQIATALAEVGTCAYFTMEMKAKEQTQRLIAQQAEVALNMVRSRFYPAGPVADKVVAFTRGRRIPIAFDDRANLSAGEIRRTALGIDGLSGIVVDQLSLMDLGASKGENLTDAIARTTSALKAMAMDLNVPVIMLSQLNREAARSGRPSRHHLYGSSAIANDADVILILHREDRIHAPQNLTLMIEKNRQGEEGDVELRWVGEFVRAYDRAS